MVESDLFETDISNSRWHIEQLERLEILIYTVEFRGTWVKSLIEF